MSKLFVIDDLAPEDVAMLQALYSRSAESAETHIDKIKASGSGKFMQSFYVNYNHKSIADTGSTTLFIENVSILAAKAVQDNPLYCGQETSTRYINMSAQEITDPVKTAASQRILRAWMHFYDDNQDRVAATIAAQHPRRDNEKPETYDKAVKARTFDVMRGFLPAGITTQLSWHTNLRQAGDQLTRLRNHPSEEIQLAAAELTELLAKKYPASGFGTSVATVSGVDNRDQAAALDRCAWEKQMWAQFSHPAEWPSTDHGSLKPDVMAMGCEAGLEDLQPYLPILQSRPRGCVLPHFMSDLGQFRFYGAIDYGAWRDIQRHRNGVCRTPILSADALFEPWYLDQLDADTRENAECLIVNQRAAIQQLDCPAVDKQHYVALGFCVPLQVTYTLPALLYVLELRSGKMIHPTLRRRIHKMIELFKARYPAIPLHVDMDPDDWDVRRGNQTITAK